MPFIGMTRSKKRILDVDDPAYRNRHRWPKWNRTVTVLDGIPGLTRRVFYDYTADDHLDAAARHAEERELAAGHHGKLLRRLYQEYGERGSYISGVGQNHFPERAKDDLRLYARLASDNDAAAAAHWGAATRKSYRDSGLAAGRPFVYTK